MTTRVALFALLVAFAMALTVDIPEPEYASTLRLPSKYSFTMKNVVDKKEVINGKYSFDGELFYFSFNGSYSAMFKSNNTLYSQSAKGSFCYSVTLTKEQSEQAEFSAWMNKNNKPLNKACSQGAVKGELYAVNVPSSTPGSGDLTICVGKEGTVPLYADAKTGNSTGRIEFINFSAKPDPALANFRLSKECLATKRPDGVKLNLPNTYSYAYEYKSEGSSSSGNFSYTSSGTVNDNGQETVITEKTQYWGRNSYYFRSNSTSYSSYDSFCSAYKQNSATKYFYEDNVSEFRAYQSDTNSVQFPGVECESKGVKGWVWQRYETDKLCVNKAGDTPLWFEATYPSSKTRKTFTNFKTQADAGAAWQMPQKCLDAKPKA